MPRLPGGPATNLPPCPKEGHEHRRVVKDGPYGNPPRQRFRCIGPGGPHDFHRFVPPAPRVMKASGICDTCDNEVHTHDGPLAGRTYAFPLREVATAFVGVGTGASYTQAGDRARVSTRRRRLDRDRGAALVVEWLDLLGPTVAAHYAETAWPETLVLDSTRFMLKNVRTGTQALAFNVLGAYGYPEHGKPRVWKLHATHHAREEEWVKFLTSLDTAVPPRLVVCDGADEIANAVRTVWPETPGPSFPVPFVARCELHLHRNGLEAMAADQIGGHLHWMRTRLGTAFLRWEGWTELVEKATGFAGTQVWLDGIAGFAPTQVGTRHLLPAHHSTAALDMALGRVRDFLDSRSFVLRNARRTDVTLALVRNHLNGLDIERDYYHLLRARLDATGGRLPAQRAGGDKGTSRRADRADRAVASLRA